MERNIALAGNPNVGKSSLFNKLTGMKQHTGNWTGKTVESAKGTFVHNNQKYTLCDLPGTYSLYSNSKDEEVASDFICFGNPDAVIVVCDATCLERNLILVLQILEVTKNVLVCINLIDEARKKHITIDSYKLQNILGIPVSTTSARIAKDFDLMLDKLEMLIEGGNNTETYVPKYISCIEDAVNILIPTLEKILDNTKIPPGFAAVRLLCNDEQIIEKINKITNSNILSNQELQNNIKKAFDYLEKYNITKSNIADKITANLVISTESIANECVTFGKQDYDKHDRFLDRLITGKWTAFPIMLMMLAMVFWITITGANYISEILWNNLAIGEEVMLDFFRQTTVPKWIYECFVLGIYKTVAWVVSVMLPPMSIFFPLFTLMEDFGLLPRVAFNIDRYFRKCNTCGKQFLTMCQGIGCNSVGVIGARIINSPKERMIAILTNSFMPCNGRFPALIAIISIFLIGGASGFLGEFSSAIVLTGFVLLSIIITFFVSRILSCSVLKAESSSFALELPPYRPPDFKRIIVRSIFDRTLKVLGRAVAVSIPAGFFIYILANISIDGNTILCHLSNFFDPFGRLMGLDGVILLSFILGFPANEIVIPIAIMAYMNAGSITEIGNLESLHRLLTDNGWNLTTAICCCIFTLFHFPCSTTCLTINRETGSLKWTLFSFILPTIIGIILCISINFVFKLILI